MLSDDKNIPQNKIVYRHCHMRNLSDACIDASKNALYQQSMEQVVNQTDVDIACNKFIDKLKNCMTFIAQLKNTKYTKYKGTQ